MPRDIVTLKRNATKAAANATLNFPDGAKVFKYDIKIDRAHDLSKRAVVDVLLQTVLRYHWSDDYIAVVHAAPPCCTYSPARYWPGGTKKNNNRKRKTSRFWPHEKQIVSPTQNK